jgi:membrane dipeptidase
MIDTDIDEDQFHRESMVVDLHADTPVLLRLGYDLGQRHEPPLPMNALGFHLDLPRMREGGLNAQFFGLTSFPTRWILGGPASTVDRQLDALEDAEAANARTFALVTRAAEVRDARAAGQVAGLRGIEGAHALEGDLDRLAHFAKRGVVYLGLLHFSSNEAGAPAKGRGRDESLGLTDFGRELVDELNRLKVLVDLTHINRKGFLEAARRSRSPVIVSHTGVLGAHAHWRNIDDEQIRAVAQGGGCVGVIFSRLYLGHQGLEGVCTHLEHLIKVGGEDTPALGSDFDGMVTPPRGLGDASELPNLTRALLSRGLSRDQVSKILGENVLRVLASVRG